MGGREGEDSHKHRQRDRPRYKENDRPSTPLSFPPISPPPSLRVLKQTRLASLPLPVCSLLFSLPFLSPILSLSLSPPSISGVDFTVVGVRLLLFGATFPLSSPVALSFLAGLKAAFQLTNEAGGVQDGMNLSLAVLDDGGNPELAVANAQQLISERQACTCVFEKNSVCVCERERGREGERERE